MALLLGTGIGKMTEFWRWLKSLFIKEYQVTIWVDPMKKTEYFFRTISKVSPTHIKGKLASGELLSFIRKINLTIKSWKKNHVGIN